MTCVQLSGLALTLVRFFKISRREIWRPFVNAENLSNFLDGPPLDPTGTTELRISPFHSQWLPLCLTGLASSFHFGRESDFSGRKAAGPHGQPCTDGTSLLPSLCVGGGEEIKHIQEGKSQFPLSLPKVLANFQKQMLSNFSSFVWFSVSRNVVDSRNLFLPLFNFFKYAFYIHIRLDNTNALFFLHSSNKI